MHLAEVAPEIEKRFAQHESVHIYDRSGNASICTALAHAIDGLPDAILLLDESWRVIYANQTARRVGHIEPENLNRETLWELYPEIDGTKLGHAYREAVATRTVRVLDAFFYEPFHTWFDMRIFPMEHGLVAHFRDVTAVHDAAEQLEQVLGTTTDAVVSMDREWRITHVNQRATEILAPSGNVLGTNIWESFPGMLSGGSPYLKHYFRAMNERVTAQFDAYYPEPLNMSIHVVAQPARDGIIVFFRDVTEQKRTALGLIQSEKLAAVGRLASSIAHEINNPLESVGNLLYLAQQHAEVPEEVQRYLETADKELRRVSIIVNQTLLFHKQGTKPQAMGSAALFSTVLGIFEGRLKNANIKVENRERTTKTVVCCDGEIRQVLNNLVGNAFDAMPSGGRLLLRSREATDWITGRRGLVLTVADTGSGIDPQTQTKMYQAFFTTKGLCGAGLGLWISAEIIDRHQGRIRVRSSQHESHSGTVFTLFLPFQTSEAPLPQAEA
jgi:signal transduction histidine kinase